MSLCDFLSSEKAKVMDYRFGFVNRPVTAIASMNAARRPGSLLAQGDGRTTRATGCPPTPCTCRRGSGPEPSHPILLDGRSGIHHVLLEEPPRPEDGVEVVEASRRSCIRNKSRTLSGICIRACECNTVIDTTMNKQRLDLSYSPKTTLHPAN
jgi:hypothetical protein